MKVIRDSIHGDIFLKETELKVVDTLEFQRLRRLKQLGMTCLVYPSANHTRFEHSLGALHLAGKLAGKLGLPGSAENKIRLAALLHDIGHGPLSHTSEELLQRYLGERHEKITERIIENSEITGILEEAAVKPKEISDIVAGKQGYLSRIISSEFDVDRMDFLVRDAHHTGAAYGIIDLDRLLNTLRIYNNDLVVEEGGLRAVEALLVARFLMTPTVYLHHTSRIADAMFRRATERAIEVGLLDYELLHKMDDYSMQNLFRSSMGYVYDIGARFDRRELFKKAYSTPWRELSEKGKKKAISLRKKVGKWKKLEGEIAQDLGIEPGYALLDIPSLSHYKEVTGHVVIDDKLLEIGEASPLIRILRKAQEEFLDVAIYVPEEHLEKFENFEPERYLV